MGSNFTVPLATSLWNPSHRSDERSPTVAKPSQAAFAHPLLLSPPGCAWAFAVGINKMRILGIVVRLAPALEIAK